MMRVRKRLEESLATEADLARREGDISAYFELAREGESVDADLKREIDSLRALVESLETKTLLSGETKTLANEVCRRACWSKGEMRTSRCTPISLVSSQ